MNATVVLIVIGGLGMITKGLLSGREDLEIGELAKTIQTTALLRSTRILRKVQEIWRDLLSLRRQLMILS